MGQLGNHIACFTSRVLNIWIINTGASNHMTRNKYVLHDLFSTLSLPTITLENGTASRIESVGTTKNISSLPFSYVFYTPKFPFILSSIRELTQSLNYSIIFFPDYCVF